MRAKILFGVLSALVLILSAGLVSAAITDVSSSSGSTLTAQHGQTISFNIVVTSDVVSPATESVTFQLPLGTASAWLTGLPTVAVTVNSGLNYFPVTLTVPQYTTAPGSYTLDISTNPVTFPVAVSIVVPSSPSLTINPSQAISKTQNGTITVTNTGNVNILANLTATGAFPVAFLLNGVAIPSSGALINPGIPSQPITVYPTSDLNNLLFGTNTITVTAKDLTVGSTATQPTISYSLDKTFCSNGEVGGNLTLYDVKFTNVDGDEDEEWQLLNTITVEVKAKNNNEEDSINDVYVELGLFNSAGSNVADELTFSNSGSESFRIGRIKAGEKGTALFEFKVPADFEDGSYKLAVKAYTDDEGENAICDDNLGAGELNKLFYQEIDITNDEESPIAVDNIQLSSDKATCGDRVTMTFEVFNVGDTDQDKVKINIFNSDLKINEVKEISSFDVGDGEKFELIFSVPASLADKAEIIKFTTEYEYNEDDDVYDETSEKSWSKILNVEGCSGSVTANDLDIDISAELDSEAIPGENLVVTSTIKNSGTTQVSYVVDASGYESWAVLDSISSRLITLSAGESKDVSFTFVVDEAASDTQTFSIDVASGGKLESRQVEVTLESGSFFAGNKTLVWIIGLVNIALIAVIIVVAIKLSRR